MNCRSKAALVAGLFLLTSSAGAKPAEATASAKAAIIKAPRGAPVVDAHTVRDELASKFEKLGDTKKTDAAVILTLKSENYFSEDGLMVRADKAAALNDLAAALKSIQGTPVRLNVYSGGDLESALGRAVAVLDRLVSLGVDGNPITPSAKHGAARIEFEVLLPAPKP